MFFPCSSAKSTVIDVPLLVAASTTNTPSLKPLIILFLSGKFNFSGLVPIIYSERITPPFLIISWKILLFSGG